MRETRLLVASTLLVVSTTFAFGIAGGDLVGYGYPGSQSVSAIGWLLAGLLIVRSEAGHPVGRLLMWSGLVWAIVALVFQVWQRIDLPIWMVGDVVLAAAFARFPDGEWITPRAPLVPWLTGSIAGVALVVWSIGPVGLPAWVEDAPYIAFQTAIFVAVLWLLVNLWRAGPVVRRQAGWVLLAIAVLGFTGALAAAVDGQGGGGVATLASALATPLIPLSIVVAVTKYRLYEIDRILSRTVAYGLVVAAMALVYFGVVLVLGSLLPVDGDLPVAVATLAAVGVSVPLLRRVRAWVDRRFFRFRYDSAEVVARVADDLRTTVDLSEVESRTVAVVDEVFAPEAVSVWLAGER